MFLVSSWNVLRPVLLFVDMCVLGTPAQFESAELKVSAYCVHSKSDGACSTIVLSLLRWDITRWYVLPLSADPCSIVDEVSSLDIMRQVLQALDHIHSHGVMHRDVKARIAFMLFVSVVAELLSEASLWQRCLHQRDDPLKIMSSLFLQGLTCDVVKNALTNWTILHFCNRNLCLVIGAHIPAC